MTFSTEWENLYSSSSHMSIWPWSDLVSYVHRYAGPSKGYSRVLELGCGAGANIPFFLNIGADFYSIEGSESAVGNLLRIYPQLENKVLVGDFTKSLMFSGAFDLVIDRASLPHNETCAITHTLSLIYDGLRDGGKFIGIDWFSDRHADANRGDPIDEHTRCNLPLDSHLSGTGVVHFFSEEHIRKVLEHAGFKIEILEHKLVERRIPNNGIQLGWWNFVAVKA